MKKIKKVFSLMLVLIMVFGSMSVPSTSVEAAVTAKSLVSSALKYMESFDTISYSYSWDYTSNDVVRSRTGMVISDSEIEHGFYMDDSQIEKAWEEYQKKNKIYRKGASSSEWTIYTDTTYDSNSKSLKKGTQYLLGHLKNMKITSTGEKSYTITASPDYSDTNIKKITITIDKKKKCVTKIKKTYKDHEGTYYNSSNKYPIKNEVVTWSNICYGKGGLKIPSGL